MVGKMRSKRLTKLIIFSIALLIILSNTSTINASLNDKNTSMQLEEKEAHIIDNPRVPYVSQETEFYCGFASFTMILKYYGNNITLQELLYNSGIGYTMGYFRPKKLQITTGTTICMPQGVYFTGNFLASLYGLSFDFWKPTLNGNKWEEYWSRLKEKIKQNIPVATSIDPFTLAPSFYKEKYNIPDDGDPHSGHAIVIVGFNEPSQKVYYNEPFPTVYGESEENWTYANVSIEIFKNSLHNASGPEFCPDLAKYIQWSFEKTSEPLSKEEIFDKSHERNIQRLNGKYSEIFYNIIPFTDYGIKAVKSLKRDLSPGLRHRFATLLSIENYHEKNYTIPVGEYRGDFVNSIMFRIHAIEKRNASQYLLANKHISPLCEKDGELLAQEANHWDNLSILINKLYKAADNGFLKLIIGSKPILDQMKKELEEIIIIEEKIID